MTAYHPNADQLTLAASIGESLASILPLTRLREAQDENAETWIALRELGVFAIAQTEELGGSGLGVVEEALIVLELGRRVAAPSVLATVGASILQPHAHPRARLSGARVAAGYRRGSRVVYVEDTSATLLLVHDGSRTALFELPSSSHVVDQQLWSSRLRETSKLGEALAEADDVQALRLRLIDAAALAGIARAALDMAVEHALVREQFGRPIGSFQAVKHHCANMALAARLAWDQVSFAALAVHDHSADAALQVESAFFMAASAAIESCAKNIQIHGGIGFSDEALPHRLLKRARILVEIAGGLEAALTRIGCCQPGELLAREA